MAYLEEVLSFFDGFGLLIQVGMIVLIAILVFGFLALIFQAVRGEDNWQQMFCPEDRSSCYCRSCREERGEA